MENKKKGIKLAAALRYEQEMDDAPRVLGIGRGELAEKIIKIASENNIPIHEDPELAFALSGLEVGQEIPLELYRAVAEVLSFIMLLEGKTEKDL